MAPIVVHLVAHAPAGSCHCPGAGQILLKATLRLSGGRPAGGTGIERPGKPRNPVLANLDLGAKGVEIERQAVVVVTALELDLTLDAVLRVNGAEDTSHDAADTQFVVPYLDVLNLHSELAPGTLIHRPLGQGPPHGRRLG